MPITNEIERRIEEASDRIREVRDRFFRTKNRELDPQDRDEVVGYEYYQLIATIEGMSSHDIYTLFKSP